MQNGTSSWIKLIGQVGFPIVVAMILLGMMAGYIPSPITKVEAKLAELNTVLNARTTGFDTHIATTATQNSEIVKLLRVICRHTAADKAEQAECDK